MDDYTDITDDAIYAPIMADSFKILDFLNKVNGQTAKRITQKWIFVDLFYLLYQNKEKLKDLRPPVFAQVYLQFDEDRLKHNAEPEKLLSGRSGREARDLYDYIMAFKLSGGERKNLTHRNSILSRRFKKALGA